jgi:hypothetical protein
MLTDAERDHLGMMTRTLQIILFALASGVVTFGVVVTFISQAQQTEPILTYLAVAASVAAILASFVVPSILSAGQRNAIAAGKWPTAQFAPQSTAAGDELGDVGPLLAVYQTRQIIRAAILEGAAFFDLTAYLLEKQPLRQPARNSLPWLWVNHEAPFREES